MKSFIRFLTSAFAISILPAASNASVFFTNNNPGYVAKVDMYTVVDNQQWGVTTFSCEHYLGHGESLNFEDYPPITYMLTGILWIPTENWKVSGLSLSTGTGWEFVANVQNGSSYVFHNMGSDTVTLRARDAWGNIADSGIQWHVTDLINDVVTQDWSTNPTFTIGNLAAGKAIQVRSRRAGGSTEFSTNLSFASGNWHYGSNGKRAEADNTYPYGSQRVGACSLGCLRNVLKIKNKEVPTENDIVSVLASNGKPEADFLKGGVAMGHSEAEARFNLILNPKGLSATNHDPISRDQILAKLNDGNVLIVGIKKWIGDPRDPENPLRIENHMIVMRKVTPLFGGPKIEIIDPAEGETTKKPSDKAMDLIDFGGNPPSTARIWEISDL